VNERERVALLTRIFGDAIGDDCATLEPPRDDNLVWTVDACVEGTHFRREWLSWEDLGWKSFMAAASDIAAMGAEPIGALSALVLTTDVDDASFEAIARGQKAAADAIGAAVVGGNLARGNEVSITTTVLGRAARAVLRSGARAGDLVLVAGELGHADAALAALQAGDLDSPYVVAWQRPRARIEDGKAMAAAGATAAMDISDGLAIDAHRLAEASGVAIVFDDAALESYGVDVAHVLRGGEDYALLVTAPQPIAGFKHVGRVERGSGLRLASGRTIEPEGFDHF
jgi:thiamine-monophosphate kinase